MLPFPHQLLPKHQDLVACWMQLLPFIRNTFAMDGGRKCSNHRYVSGKKGNSSHSPCSSEEGSCWVRPQACLGPCRAIAYFICSLYFLKNKLEAI